MIPSPRRLSVLVPDPELARGLPRLSCIQRLSDPSEDLSALTTYVFVVVSLLDLPKVAGFVREANQRHHLRGLFVRDGVNSQLLPQVLQRANLRAVKTLVLHSDPNVPNRVLRAYCIGAEDDLIADARLIEDRLFLISCSGEVLDLPLIQHPILRTLPKRGRGQFSVAADGAYLHWPKPDIHLDLEDARILLFPREREKAMAKRAQATERFGRAVAALRQRHGLTQTDLPGISERQLRRYEHGARVPVAALRLLAKAHGMELMDYLNELAKGTA